ncbi:MAG: FAD binding domain-containing protein [Ramlibacter sp.]|nr:FAD binding domain-containing protein [Cryobacterium sp.]
MEQIPAPFDYVRGSTVDNALALLERHGPESRVVAGGHSLLPMMKLRLARPECLIDINDLFELDFVLRDGDTLRIGAHSLSASEKVERRVGDWAVVAAGASVTLAAGGTVDEFTIGLTAVGVEGTVTEAEAMPRGQHPREDLFVEAGRLAALASDPVADQRGPVDYKRHLADELTRRVLRRATARATEAQES